MGNVALVEIVIKGDPQKVAEVVRRLRNAPAAARQSGLAFVVADPTPGAESVVGNCVFVDSEPAPTFDELHSRPRPRRIAVQEPEADRKLPLSAHAIEALRLMATEPIRAGGVNPATAVRLRDEGLAVRFIAPTANGQRVPWLRITDAGRQVLKNALHAR